MEDRTYTVYVSIGNSDDKLSQADWAHLLARVQAEIHEAASAIHGEWYSAPDARWQNACFCADLDLPSVPYLKDALRLACAEFGQESIAWADAETTFIKPATEPVSP